MRCSTAITPLLVLLTPWLACGQTQISLHDPHLRMALRWVTHGWSEKSTLYFTNLLLARHRLSPEARQLLDVLIDRPVYRFQFPTRFSGLITVPQRTSLSLRYLRLMRDQPACEPLWSGASPDLARLAELELIDPRARIRARAFVATRILEIQAGSADFPALAQNLKEQLAALEGEVILHQGARQLLRAAFQMADEYSQGRFPHSLYQWLLPDP